MSSPFDDQRRLASGAAVARLERGVVTVAGPDRLTWLDSMTSQSVKGLQPGESAETLLLDPNGRIEHAMRVVDDGATTWLVVDAAEAAPLAAWLDRMRFMLRVEVADRSQELAVLGFVPDDAALSRRTVPRQEASSADLLPRGVLPAEPVALWRDPWAAVQPGGWQYATAASHPGEGWAWVEAVVPIADAPVDAVPQDAFDALRIAAWRPDWAHEVDERAIPNELDWLRSAVHLDKGCYRGQETVAKVHNLGHPPRRLVMLQLDGSDNVYAAHGDPVLLGEDQVGVVTSAAVHHEEGPIALALVKRGVDPAAGLVVRHEGAALAATQEVVVPPEAGATVDVPRIPRLGAVRR